MRRATRSTCLATEIVPLLSDASIIGGPPPSPDNHIFASGPDASELLCLVERGLRITLLPGEVGQASGLKMCFAALTKGLQALGLQALVAAEALGLSQELEGEQGGNLAAVRGALARSLPKMPPKAHRWIGEMEEVALCFSDLGLTETLFEGVADTYRQVASISSRGLVQMSVQGTPHLDELIRAVTAELSVNPVGYPIWDVVNRG